MERKRDSDLAIKWIREYRDDRQILLQELLADLYAAVPQVSDLWAFACLYLPEAFGWYLACTPTSLPKNLEYTDTKPVGPANNVLY